MSKSFVLYLTKEFLYIYIYIYRQTHTLIKFIKRYKSFSLNDLKIIYKNNNGSSIYIKKKGVTEWVSILTL